MSWNLFNHNYVLLPIKIECPVQPGLISPTDFDIAVNSERAPYCQDSIVSADQSGNVIAFLSGARPGSGSTSTVPDGFFHVSNDYGATWTQHNMREIPGRAGDSGTSFRLSAHGIARHPSGKITINFKGVGFLFSNDGGSTWSIASGDTDWRQAYGLGAKGEDVIAATGTFNKCGTDGFGTVSSVARITPENLASPTHKCITNQTTGESFCPINVGGRIFVEGINNTDQIVEWYENVEEMVSLLHQTTGFSIGDKLRRSWAVDQSKQEWIIPYNNYQSGLPVTEIRYFHIYMNGLLEDLTIVDRTIDVSAYVGNLVNNTIAMGGGNGLYVSAIWERVGSLPTNNLLISASADGINWIHHLCAMDERPDEVFGSNEGNPGAVRWAGGNNWLYSYTGNDGFKRVHTMKIGRL